jgi:hypothetical protein
MAILVGEPVALMTVPVASYLVDHFRNQRHMKRWYVRVPMEVLLAVPAWVAFWVWVEFRLLGWVWI